jgi:hypothetical protein
MNYEDPNKNLKNTDELRLQVETDQINKKYASLSKDQQAIFPQAQAEVSQMIADHVSGKKTMDIGLIKDPHTLEVIGQLEDLHKANPGLKDVKPGKVLDQKRLENLVRKLSIDKVEQGGLGEKQQVAETPKTLTPEQQKAQQEREQSSQILADHFQGKLDLPAQLLHGGEITLLSKMRTLYDQQKTVNPDQPVAFQFDNPQDLQTYNNLLHRLPLVVKEHGHKQQDQMKADEIRGKLGLEKQHQEVAHPRQKTEETTSSQAEGIKKVFEMMGSGVKESAIAKTQEYHERLSAAQAGKPLKAGDTVENLLPDFKRLTKTEWTPDFDIEKWKSTYGKDQERKNHSENLSEQDILEMKNEAGKKMKGKGIGDYNIDLMMAKIDPEIGRNFDAHGIAKGKESELNQLDSLLNFLQKGIDPERPFHTAPLRLRKDDAKGAQSAGGTATDTGGFIILGEYKKMISESGIKYVLVNDAYYEAIDKLSKAFPQVEFIRADQANEKLKEIVEGKYKHSP